MNPASPPVSTPLKVRQRRHRIWAEDASGQVVVDGRTRDHWPERYVAQTASGTHRVAARVETGGPDRYLPIIDARAGEIGRIVTPRRKDWVLQLVTGETAVVAHRGGFIAPMTCTIGDLSSAAAPRLAPQRHFMLNLAPSVLAHPARDALVVALVWISESTIADMISDSAGDGG